ncbi:MAG: molybdenum transporter, periplasmic molybdate-binding protein [Frankiales bacterium]|nr:molybdenum transporter, periplasmic molybdate-binding protein [Frankiales bacterium]
MTDHRVRRVAAVALTAGALASVSSCRATAPAHTLSVFAASSLTETFTVISADFEKAHPGWRVQLSFGPSSTLVQQALAGAAVDVLAVADAAALGPVADRLAGARVTFARNRLQIVTPGGNPAHVASLPDLARGGLRVVVCAAAVPCGAAARRLLADQHVTIAPASEERDVKAVLTKVRLREADAGLVYRTDVISAGREVTGVDVPDVAAARTDDVAAVLAGNGSRSAAGDMARLFVESLTVKPATDRLNSAGFALP